MLNTYINKNYLNIKAVILFVLYFKNYDYYRKNLTLKETIFKNAQRKLNITISHFQNDYY